MRLHRGELHGLAGAYALDALDGPDLDRFTRHLQQCSTCENEVRGFRETAARLALAVAAPPPVELRGRVLSAVAITRQLPPAAATAPARRAAPRRAAPPRAAGPDAGRVRRTWLPRMAALAAAAGVIAAVLLGVAQSATQHRLTQAEAQNRALAAVLAAPDAHLMAVRSTTGGMATVVVSPAHRSLIVTTSGLPELTGGKVYELWFINSGTARAAGLLPAPSGGHTSPFLASGLASGDKVALTVEPAGGTKQPTTKPILLFRLPV